MGVMLDDYIKLLAMPVYQKIGFHVGVGGNRNGIGAYFGALDTAGIPINLMSVGDYGVCKEVIDLSWASGVPHIAAWRRETDGSGFNFRVPPYHLEHYVAAGIYWQKLIAVIPQEFDKEKAWLIICNEPDKNRSDWLGFFGHDIATYALQDGYKVALFGFATGEPEYDDWETNGMRKFLGLAGQHPEQIAVSLHEYSLDIDDILNGAPYLVGRCYSHMFDACDGMGIPRPSTLISEWGWEAFDVPTPAAGTVDVLTVADLYAPYPQILGAHIWYLGMGFGEIANQAQKLIVPVTAATLAYESPVDPEPPVEPPVEPGATLEDHLWNVSLNAQTVSLNKDAALQKAILAKGYTPVGTEVWTPYGNEEYALMPAEELTGKPRLVAWAKVPNWNQVQFLDKPVVDEPAEFAFTHWPAVSGKINQWFGARPDYYKQWNLPGHDGVDIAGSTGDRVVAPASGKVYHVHIMERDGYHNYGNHVRIEHSDGYKSILAHLDYIAEGIKNLPEVVGGAFIGGLGSTGNSSGPHLHVGLKHYPVGQDGWPYNLIDPWPFLAPVRPAVPPDPTPTGMDLAPYFTGGFTDKGTLYEVQTEGAGQQRHQTQVEGQVFYHTKSSEWEQLRYDDYFIWRFTDTSMGQGRYYQLRDGGQDWSKWAPRRMSVGQVYQRNPVVTVYDKENCGVIQEASALTWIRMAAHYSEYQFFTGITLRNVVKLQWLSSPEGEPIETYWYAIGYGLVGWAGAGRRAAISEIHNPGARPDNVREVIHCI